MGLTSTALHHEVQKFYQNTSRAQSVAVQNSALMPRGMLRCRLHRTAATSMRSFMSFPPLFSSQRQVPGTSSCNWQGEGCR